MSERDKARSDLHNTGDEKYREHLMALNREILTLESATGDARV